MYRWIFLICKIFLFFFDLTILCVWQNLIFSCVLIFQMWQIAVTFFEYQSIRQPLKKYSMKYIKINQSPLFMWIVNLRKHKQYSVKKKKVYIKIRSIVWISLGMITQVNNKIDPWMFLSAFNLFGGANSVKHVVQLFFIYLVLFLGDRNSVYLVKSELWWNYVLEMPMALFHSDYVIQWKVFVWILEWKQDDYFLKIHSPSHHWTSTAQDLF